MEKVKCNNCGAIIFPSTAYIHKDWCSSCSKAYELDKENGLQRMVGKNDLDKLKELQLIRKDIRYKERIEEEIEKLKVECGNCGTKFIPDIEFEKKSLLDKGLIPDKGLFHDLGSGQLIRCSYCNQAYKLNEENGLQRMAGKSDLDKLKELQQIQEAIEQKEIINKDILFSKIIKNFKKDALFLYQYGSCSNSVYDFEKLSIQDKKLLISKALREENKDLVNIVKWLVTNYNPELIPFLKLNCMSDPIQKAKDTYEKGKQFCEKEDYEKALECYIKAHELDSTNSLHLYDIGLIYSFTGHSEKAIEYFEKTLVNQIYQYGEQHKSVIESYIELGSAWQRLNQYRKAIEYFEKAVDLNIVMHGKKHTDTANSYHEAAKSYFNCGNYTKAVLFHEKALSVRLDLYGEKHYDIAASWSCLGSCWWKLANQKKSIGYSRKTPGSGVTKSWNNLGSVWKNLEEYRKAIDYYEKALASIQLIFGEEHPSIAVSCNNLGSVWKDLGEYHMAVKYYEKAVQVRRLKLGKDHKDTTDAEQLLSEAQKALKNP